MKIFTLLTSLLTLATIALNAQNNVLKVEQTTNFHGVIIDLTEEFAQHKGTDIDLTISVDYLLQQEVKEGTKLQGTLYIDDAKSFFPGGFLVNDTTVFQNKIKTATVTIPEEYTQAYYQVHTHSGDCHEFFIDNLSIKIGETELVVNGDYESSELAANISPFKDATLTITPDPLGSVVAPEIPDVTAIDLYNATTSEKIQTITSGSVFNLSNITNDLAIVAIGDPEQFDSELYSCKMVLKKGDEIVAENIDVTAPYTLFGEDGETMNAWSDIAEGSYTVVAYPYDVVASAVVEDKKYETTFEIIDEVGATSWISTGTDNWYYVSQDVADNLATDFEAEKASTTPILDDKRVDDVWNSSEWNSYQVVKIHDPEASGISPSNPVSEDDFSIQWKAVWDEQSVYFLAQVTDDAIIYNPNYNQFWSQDGFEFYFVPLEDMTNALKDNGTINRDDPTMCTFHVIMADTDGNPVKLSHPEKGAEGADATPTSEGWRYAGGNSTDYFAEGQFFEENGLYYYEWKVADVSSLPNANGKQSYSKDDIVRAELVYNESDEDHAANRDIINQVSVFGGEAKNYPDQFMKLKLIDSSTGTRDLSKSDFTVFPNPADHIVYFNSTINVKLITLTGKVIQSATQVNTLDVSEVNPGLYLLQTDQSVTKLVIQ